MLKRPVAKKRKLRHSRIAVFCLACLAIPLWYCLAEGSIKGLCSDCHTMHNSQNAQPFTYDGSNIPNGELTRSTCYGCHAQGGPTPTVNIGPNIVPQVMHSGTQDLAGGNFGYITGLAGSGASDSKGHNIADLTGKDSVFTGLTPPPGALIDYEGNPHPSPIFLRSDILRCAGSNGCHGYRAAGGAINYYPNGIPGAHHNNENGQLTIAKTPASSYRFLDWVKGYESPDWQENPSPSNHNEYFALPTPKQFGCDGSGPLSQCHMGPGGLVVPPDGTMSQFCGTCHGNFHTVEAGLSTGIGPTASSPFIRHPTDLSLPATGEYAGYTQYNVNVPVARLVVPAAPSAVVTPGSDAVMCLSCHVAHASNYPFMLRWDYNKMVAGNAGAASGTGCFACHTTKD